MKEAENVKIMIRVVGGNDVWLVFRKEISTAFVIEDVANGKDLTHLSSYLRRTSLEQDKLPLIRVFTRLG